MGSHGVGRMRGGAELKATQSYPVEFGASHAVAFLDWERARRRQAPAAGTNAAHARMSAPAAGTSAAPAGMLAPAPAAGTSAAPAGMLAPAAGMPATPGTAAKAAPAVWSRPHASTTSSAQSALPTVVPPDQPVSAVDVAWVLDLSDDESDCWFFADLAGDRNHWEGAIAGETQLPLKRPAS